MSSPWRQLFGRTTVLELGARGVPRRPPATMAVICTALAATIGYAVSAQGGATPQSGQAGGPPVYDPYPPGVLPPDLDAETAEFGRKSKPSSVVISRSRKPCLR